MIPYTKELIKQFKNKKILNMEELKEIIPNRSRSTIMRALAKLDYLTSYNNAGGYYTLKDIPEFDDVGIWKYNGANFSLYGTLKDTVSNIVKNSDAGYTHSELTEILGVRTHNTLLDLVVSGEIARETFKNTYVYVNSGPDDKKRQLEERANKPEANEKQSEIKIHPFILNEVLQASIAHPEFTAREIRRCLMKEGISIDIKQVEKIFKLHGLGKKKLH